MPEVEWERFAPHLTHVPLGLGDVIYESGTEQPYVYFPTDSIVSLLYVMEDGSSAEIAIVGNEGLVGISLFMGGGTTPSRAIVQSGGHAFRMKARFVRDEFVLAGHVQQLFLRYTQALLTQMGQTAVCNRHHTVDQQLCRWLLMSLDRLSSNELTMTQELIANMLGVRREGVTEAAGKLQRAGVINTAAAGYACSTGNGWRAWRANATKWSEKSSPACCLAEVIKLLPLHRRSSRVRGAEGERVTTPKSKIRISLYVRCPTDDHFLSRQLPCVWRTPGGFRPLGIDSEFKGHVCPMASE